MFEKVAAQLAEEDAAEAASNSGKETPETPEDATPPAKTEDPPKEETPKPQKLVFEEEVPAEVPTPKEEKPSEDAPMELADDTKIKDPISGEVTTWGKIKNREQDQNRDYHRKMQDLAEERRELRKEEPPPEEEPPVEEDLLADIDPTDPVVRMIRQQGERIAQVEEENTQLRTKVNDAERRTNDETLEQMERKALEDYPVLDQEEVDLAGTAYMRRIRSGETVKWETVVKERAEKLMKLEAGSVAKWKEAHLKPAREEPEGTGALEKKEPVSGADFMKHGMADTIAQADANLSAQSR
jgi:hypothetical protein